MIEYLASWMAVRFGVFLWRRVAGAWELAADPALFRIYRDC